MPALRRSRASWALSNRVRAAVLVAPILLTPPSLALAQQPGPVGTITGRVVSAVTREPLADALVRLAGDSAAARVRAVTGADGRFTLTGVPAGIARLEVRRLGYQPVLRPDVVVSPSKPAEVLIALQPSPLRLTDMPIRAEFFAPVPPAATPVSTQRLSAEEIRRAPGVQEDVVRAVSVLPGVGVTSAARNDLIVRGGAPAENLFVVDNIEVPNVNHFGTQGSTGGPVSILNIDFIREASLSAGGFGPRFGDKTSSATVIQLREGTRERFSSQLNLSATGYGAFAEGPLGGKGSFLVGARRSYLDLLFNALGASFIPAYQDFTAKLVGNPTARDQVSFLAIGAVGTVTFNDETADNRYDNRTVASPTQRQYFSGLTWQRSLSRGVLVTTLGRTFTTYETVQRDSGTATRPPQPVLSLNSREGENSLRADLTWQATDKVSIEAGNIAKFASDLAFDVTLAGQYRRDAAGVPRPLRADTTFTAFRNATYGTATWQATDKLRLSGGARVDHYAFLDGATRVGPRGSASYALGPMTTLTVAGGRYWQAPSYIWLVGDATNRQRVRPFRADQLVLGWQRVLRSDLKLQVEGYAKRYAEYPARLFRPAAVLQPSGFDDVTTDIPLGLEPLASLATGRAEGIEALLQKTLGEIPVYGLVSVSLNRTQFTSLQGGAIRGAFDTPLIVNAMAGWRPNRRWELSGRIRAASGLPTTPFVTGGPLEGTLDFARYNQGPRLASFFAADVRVDRRWQVFGKQVITYLDLQNVTNRQNAQFPQWDPRTRAPLVQENLGLLPSIGVNWQF